MNSADFDPIRMMEEATRRLNALVPPAATTHFINAQKELVLGFTALVEHASRRQPPPGPATRRRSSPTTRPRRPRRVSVD